MYINKACFKNISMILVVSASCLWSQVGQATDTVSVTMTGIIQAPAASKTSTDAGIALDGTRMIYDGNRVDSTITVHNQGEKSWLIQSWLDSDGAQENNRGGPKLPFDLRFQLDPGGNYVLHVKRSNGEIPPDRESVYWLNINAIPDETNKQKNELALSVNQRLKLFYRPVGINAPSENDYRKLTFHREGTLLRVNNPTVYYMTFYSLNVGGKQVNTKGAMVPPKGMVEYKLPADVSDSKVTLQIINDYGIASSIVNTDIQ